MDFLSRTWSMDPETPIVPDRKEMMRKVLRKLLPGIWFRSDDFELHPAQYRLLKFPAMRNEMRFMRDEQVHLCRSQYPDLPTDSVEAWNWLIKQPHGPGVYEYFNVKPC